MNFILLQSDVSLFIGRFHPLVVHLPIGFLLLAVLFYFLSFISAFKVLKNSLVYILFFGALAALSSVIIGWLLASKGGYNEEILGWHKWLGIALVITSFLLWAWFKWGKEQKMISTFLMAVVLLLITLTGHLGGTLTHGERYVYEHAPDFIRTQFLTNNGIEPALLPSDADSVLIYADLVKPVLDLKCISCHNNNNQSGGLNLTNLDLLLAGGDNGDVVIAGSIMSSELFKRISMNPNDRKFMPPNAHPLSYTETLLIKEWIRNDLDTSIAITDDRLSAELKDRLKWSYGLDPRKKSFLEKLNVAALDEKTLDKIKSGGFSVRNVAADLNLIEVKSKDSVSLDKLELLKEAKEQIVWLSLNGSGIGDDHLNTINTYENLVRLDLHNNPITTIEPLARLAHLEVLNIHSTQVSDSAVGNFEKFNALKKVYLWQTLMSQKAVDSLRDIHPNLEVNFGSTLQVKEPKKEEE